MKASLFFDGSLKQNEKLQLAFSYILKDENDEIIESNYYYCNAAKPLINSVNTAEYLGLIKGLEAAIKHDIKEIHVYGDSQIVVYQLCGKYAVKAAHLKILYSHVMILGNMFNSSKIEWIDRSKNHEADRLCKR